ncbi:MAG: hypothetical protein QM758_27015 [Armatimonas sp.]
MKILTGAIALSLCAVGGAAFAQGATPGAQNPPAASTRQSIGKPIKEVTTALGKAAGVEVLIDSGLMGERTTFKDTEVTPATLEAALDKLVKTLPQGTAWAKAYLPEPPPGKKYNGDALAQYVMAQAGLFGKAGTSEPGKVELLGKQVPTEEAQPMVAGLKLRPYYVVSRGRRPMFASGGGPGGGALGALGGVNIMDMLMKQLNVTSPDQIQPGSYKVSLPGPDGNPRDAEVTVDNTDGGRRVMVRMGDVNKGN